MDPGLTEGVGVPYSTNDVVERAFSQGRLSRSHALVVDPNAIALA